MYPIKFLNIYIPKIWGGRSLGKYKNDLPLGDIGEVWDISAHPEGISIVANGEYKDMNLLQLVEMMKEKIVGKEIPVNKFPLMIRYVSAKENLSVQVHPNDQYAFRNHEESGKVEAWYILEAPPDAYLYAGIQDCGKENIRKIIETGNIEQYLRKCYVRKGDVIFIPSGLVHAICADLTLIEISSNCNITYRIFDYNRGRNLDINEAMNVIDCNLTSFVTSGLAFKKEDIHKTYLLLNKHFCWELYDINGNYTENSDINRFYIFTCIEGRGLIYYNQGRELVQQGESILIPATLGEYKLEGNFKLLKSYVPNVANVVRTVLRQGF